MFLKVPMIIVIRFGENNVLGPIYINFGEGWRHTWFILYFLFTIHKYEKNDKKITYPKIELCIIFTKQFIS